MPGFNSGKISLIVAAFLAGGLVYLLWLSYVGSHDRPAIKIGVLHSLSGTMAISEKPLLDAVRLAVEEANQSGGVDGAKIEMVVADCHSQPATCAQEAERLITQEGVQALFGCWTSACRKAV